jgi:hypothetical protein
MNKECGDCAFNVNNTCDIRRLRYKFSDTYKDSKTAETLLAHIDSELSRMQTFTLYILLLNVLKMYIRTSQLVSPCKEKMPISNQARIAFGDNLCGDCNFTPSEITDVPLNCAVQPRIASLQKIYNNYLKGNIDPDVEIRRIQDRYLSLGGNSTDYSSIDTKTRKQLIDELMLFKAIIQGLSLDEASNLKGNNYCPDFDSEGPNE